MQNKNKPMSHGPAKETGEKAKNFKQAMSRLVKELKGFKRFIVVALILAVASSILSILSPNQLSKLTDEISYGLVINQENLEKLVQNIMTPLEEKLKEVLPEILKLDLSKEKIDEVLSSNEISTEDKMAFKNFLSSKKEDMFSSLVVLPEEILNQILPTTTYEDIEVSSKDKQDFLKVITKKGNVFPPSFIEILCNDIEIDGEVISVEDQKKFLMLSKDLNENSTPNEIYAQIGKMPKSIQTIVEPKMNIEKIKHITLFLVGLYVISALFDYIQSIQMTDVANKFARGLRNKISLKINRLPLHYFDGHQTGDILSRVTNDVDTIAQSMNHSLATLVSAITLLCGSVFMMFYTNWIMAITAIAASLFGFFFMFIILGKSQKYFVARQTELGNLFSHIEEIYSGLNVVKTYNAKDDADADFDELNEKVYNANRKSQFLSGMMMPLMSFIGNFGYVCVCIVGALLTMNGTIRFGVIVAFISYVRLFTSPLTQIAQAMTSLQSTAAASERVFEFLDEEELKKETRKKKLKKEKIKGEIEFNHVSFKYKGSDEPVIKDFTAKALPGEKIAIVGPTGAGKTTMVNLLMRFYDIDSGEIKIDGISTKDLTRENIHDLFTMVLQDTWLFEGTVYDNIVYNNKDVDINRVEEVCKIVGLDHFIKTLPNGYQSTITDQDSVSAGQRQLLTIARGMIKDAPFLILDEATSNVDTRTEELVQKAMDKLTEGRTSFIIAHRLSTIKNADLILVMKDGNIIEQGNHKTLMRKNGFYADLYNAQFKR